MVVEFRKATAEEMPEFYRQASRALGQENTLAGLDPDWTMCAFDDDQVVTTYGAWPLQIRFNGPATPAAGVTMVSTHPAHRRRGYLRSVKQKHFQEMHEKREQSLAILHPAWMAIYQRYGYGTINTRHTYKIEPRFIRFHHPVQSSGVIREVNLDEEFGLLVDVYRRFREERNGLVHRGRAMWDEGPLAKTTPERQRSIFTYEEHGEPLGYVIYTAGPGTTPNENWNSRYGNNHVSQYVDVSDFFALTPEAHQALWGLLAGIDNAEDVRWDNAPSNDPLVNMLTEPRMLNATRRDGIMARIVTLEDALPLRRYDEEGEVRFQFLDEFCDWNNGSWAFSASPEVSTIDRIPDSGADIRITPDTFASILFGHYSASEAQQAGLLTVLNQDALKDWDRIFRTRYTPYEAEHTW